MKMLADLLVLAKTYDHELLAPTLPEGKSIAAWIDHTLLKPEVTPKQVTNICQVCKAASGIRSLADAQAMIRAGVTRLGSNAGIQIVREASA